MAAIGRSVARLTSKLPKSCSYSSSAVSKFDGRNVNTVTHTGEVMDAGDWRRARFVDRVKLVNTRFAIDLVAEDPVVVCETNHVWSNSKGALGHPKVYINLDKPEVGTCGYSGRRFIQKKFYNEAEHGPCITYEQYLQEMNQ